MLLLVNNGSSSAFHSSWLMHDKQRQFKVAKLMPLQGTWLGLLSVMWGAEQAHKFTSWRLQEGLEGLACCTSNHLYVSCLQVKPTMPTTPDEKSLWVPHRPGEQLHKPSGLQSLDAPGLCCVQAGVSAKPCHQGWSKLRFTVIRTSALNPKPWGSFCKVGLGAIAPPSVMMMCVNQHLTFWSTGQEWRETYVLLLTVS